MEKMKYKQLNSIIFITIGYGTSLKTFHNTDEMKYFFKKE